MLRKLRPRLTYANVLSTFAAIGALGGVAFAGSTPDGTIRGCYSKDNGFLRIIDGEGQSCSPEVEYEIAWNQVGPQGPTGPQGPVGPEPPGLDPAAANAIEAQLQAGRKGMKNLAAATAQAAASTRTRIGEIGRALRQRGLLKEGATTAKLVAATSLDKFLNKQKIDSAGEVAMVQVLQLQMAMDREHFIIHILLNVLDSHSATARMITQHIK